MIVFTHKIAGIIFQTESDTKINCIQNDLFEKFLTSDSKFDIYQRICRIDHDSQTLPPFNMKEKERISQSLFPSIIKRSSLIIPPLLMGEKNGNYPHPIYPENVLDIPLLRSPMVRERLKYCLSHPEQVSISLHIFTITIYDYVNFTIELFYPSERNEIFNEPWVENGFRRMFASFLPAFSALMLHSACLIRNGKAIIFVAKDDGGKSTVLKNSTDGIMLSDDRNIIRKEDNIFFAYGTPWGTFTNANHHAEIGGFFLLEKAKNFELIHIKPRNALQFLWNEHSDFWHILPKKLKNQAFNFLFDACQQTPVYKMKFPKDYVDWDAIDRAMNS